MYRSSAFVPLRHYHHQSHRRREAWARLFVALILWICVSVTLRFGYYGNCHMVLGPNSSRQFEASSVFLKQVELKESGKKKGVSLHWFSEKPELSLVKKWSVSKYVIVSTYTRKGFSLWLNRGSTIRMRWEAQANRLGQLEVSLIKGEKKYQTVTPTSTGSPALYEPPDGREAEYLIEEDNEYYIGIANTSPISIVMTMNVSVSSKVYDTTKARGMCSTINGYCRLNLPFPTTHFVIVTTANDSDWGEDWDVELTFLARVVTYIAILGAIVLIVFLILKYLGVCDGEARPEESPTPPVREVTEEDPLMPEKPFGFPYGTREEDDESGESSASEDLYDGKICVICYDEPRNCFFVPCGHCATCYTCAQRIMEAEGRVCPICRRLIHKVRKLLIP
ncbi:hypothetical protein NMG60_11031213 [Bertholletia excelsa]